MTLTARTKNGMTSSMISVDFTPTKLKNPAEPRTESTTTMTPESASET